MSELAIRVLGLCYAYKSQPKQALEGINLSVRHGEFVGIIGENGAGKTTLLKNLVGLLRPTSGRIEIHGLDASQLAVSELATHVGFVLQNPDQQLFAQTVEAEVAFGPRNLGLEAEEVARRVEDAMEATGLSAFRDEFPPALSKGDRAKVVIASVLAMQPDIIILDEPTTGQDYRGCHQIMRIARQLYHQGRTVLVVTHDMSLVAEYAERTIVMNQGKVLLDEGTASVFAHPEILGRAGVIPPQITRLSQRLPQQLGLPSCALSVKDLGRAIVHRLDSRIERNEEYE